MLLRIPEAGSNKQAGRAVFINGLPVNTITISPLILSEVEVEIRGRGRGSRSGSGRGRRGLANIKQDERGITAAMWRGEYAQACILLALSRL